MASGVIIREQLFAANGAAGSSEWFCVEECEGLSFHVSGISGDTVQIHGSNATSRPASGTDGVVLATTTADDILYVLGPVRWVKAKVSTYSAGAITVNMQGI